LDARIIVFMVAVILFLTGIFFILCKLFDQLKDLTIVLKNMEKHLIGDEDHPDSMMIKPSIKELIVNRCFGIENEIVKLRYGLFGERRPSIDGVNVLDTLLKE
jgi:hypothetical protein